MSEPIPVSQTQVAESNFFSQVYLWMSAGLFISAFASFFVLASPSLLQAIVTKPLLFWGLAIAELVLVMWLSAAIFKLSALAAAAMFCVYSFLNGMTLSVIFLAYTGASVLTTFAATAGTFIFFSVYGFMTKADLTRVGQLAMMGLFGIIIGSLINLFVHSNAMMWVMTYVGIAVFLGLIAYDTQVLKTIYAQGFESRESQSKLALLGALRLYLDFINLFLMLLRIFGRQRD